MQKVFVKFDINEKIISYNNNHTSIMELLQIKKLKIMNDAKESLNKTEDIYNIKARDIFNNSIKKVIKRKSDFDGKDEEKEEKNNFNIDYKHKNTPTFDNVKHNI